MKYCPRCQRRIPDNFGQCPFDLSPLETAIPKAIDRPTPNLPPKFPVKIRLKPPPATSAASGWMQRLATAGLSLLLVGGLSFSIVFLTVYYRPKHTLISVRSEPSGAVVYLDQSRLGVTPFEGMAVPLGDRRLRINKKGFYEASQVLSLREGKVEHIKEVLEPLSGKMLSKDEVRQVAEWIRRAQRTLDEMILFPPPAEYNTVFFCRLILEIDPQNTFAQETLKKLRDQTRETAEVAYQKGDLREAEKLYINLLSLDPADSYVQYKLDELRQGIQRTDEQRREAIQQLSQRIEIACTAGWLSPPAEGNAYDLIRQLQRLDPRNANARNLRTRFNRRSSEVSQKAAAEGNWSEARRILELAIQLSPEDAELKSQLEAVQQKAIRTQLVNEERTRQQEQQRQQELRRQELRLAVVSAYRAARYEQVIEDIQKLEKDSELDEDLHFLLGMSCSQLRQYRKAVQAFEDCIAQNPKRADALLQMALLYRTPLKDLVRAERHFNRLLQLGGTGEYDPPRLQRIIQELQQQAIISQRMNQPLEVEHRHVLGSCQGKMIWGVATMQYWSTEKSHNFLRPYSQILKFERRNDILEIQFSDKKYSFRFKRSEDLKWVMDWLSEKINPNRG